MQLTSQTENYTTCAPALLCSIHFVHKSILFLPGEVTGLAIYTGLKLNTIHYIKE